MRICYKKGGNPKWGILSFFISEMVKGLTAEASETLPRRQS